jgi:catechol 2,3-dioxygenase-like lactoylglutathione lyase family enzyme
VARHGADVDRTAEWAELRARYLVAPEDRPESSARGVHHMALLSSDVVRTIEFYQGVLEFPLTELFENRDYQGSTHFFFDIGNGNALAFFDMPGLDLGPYAEVLGGIHHLAISVEPENWERIKREQEGREGVFHDVPGSLPALVQARKVQRRAASVGFEYPDTPGAVADLDDELRELKQALVEAGEPAVETEPDPFVAAELGDLLFAAVNVARRANVDPELALRAASGRFIGRVEAAERLAAEEGLTWSELPLEEQDRFYDRAKEQLR